MAGSDVSPFVPLAVAVLVAALAWQQRPRPRPPSALPEPDGQVRQLVAEARRVAAIRAYRRRSGASLHEASAVIRQLRSGSQ